MQCQVTLSCALEGDDDPTRQELHECIDKHCDLTLKPTAQPTTMPTVVVGNDTAGFSILVDDGVDGSVAFGVNFMQVTAGNVHVIPMSSGEGTPLEGEVVVTTSCKPENSLVDGRMDLSNVFLVVKRDLCNIYDTVRAAQILGAVAVVFASDALPKNIWLPRYRSFGIASLDFLCMNFCLYYLLNILL